MREPRELLQRLLEYIGEQMKDTDPRGFRLSPERGFLRRPTDLAGLPGVQFDIPAAGDHIWLRVERLQAGRPPAIPDRRMAFLAVADDPEGPPPAIDEAQFRHWLAQSSQGQDAAAREALAARGRATIELALQDYTAIWQDWARQEKPRRRTIALYGELFTLRHALGSEETARPSELVWGVGIASWRIDYRGSPVAFEYPLLTQAVEIAQDERSMALEIRPRALPARPELDALVACAIRGAAELDRAVRAQLALQQERAVSPFDAGSYSDVLRLIAGHLDSEGSYREVLAGGGTAPPPGDHLVVTDAWVLLSRPRSNNVLFEDLERLRARLLDGCALPAGPLALVSAPSDQPADFTPVDFRGISSRGRGNGTPEELYFPLPYNDEQVTIVSRLERCAGVTVQGPPGTGKTHTIANIICHYLATGRRVLVTSKGEPALEVLQSKIPEEVRPLTVALLTDDREGVRQFQGSIEAIQHRVSQLNPPLVADEIASLRLAIDRAHAELANVDRRVDAIALAQLAEFEVDGTPMRAQTLAELVVAGEEMFGWFDDAVTLAPAHAPPLDAEEAGRLKEARRTLGLDLGYVQAHVPAAEDFPAPAEIGELHGVLCRIRDLDEMQHSGELWPLRAPTQAILEQARELLQAVAHARAQVEELEALDDGWPLRLRARCRLPAYAAERAALEALLDDLPPLVDARAAFLKRPVEVPEAALAAARTGEAVQRAAATGRPFGRFALGNAEAKAHAAAIRVAGLPPAGSADWQHVHHYLTLHATVRSFVTRWNGLAEAMGAPPLAGGVAQLRQIELTARAAHQAHRLAVDAERRLCTAAEAVFATAPTEQLLGDAAALRTVERHLRAHLTRADLARASALMSTLQARLAGSGGAVSDALRQFVERELGDPAWTPEQVAGHFARLMAELRRIAGLRPLLSLVSDGAHRIEAAGAVKLAARVRSVPVARIGEDAAFPAFWREAWTWARMKSHLDTIEARDELRLLAARRGDLERGLARNYRDLVSKSAWLATKRNATARVMQALAGYATAIRRIGQGTGPNAVRYRRDARESMLEAAGAVPCWIMSHYRISETMPAEIGAFDLVIVDEASQSDLWALPAILRGARILVVGDDKQVSPDGSFIDAQRIVELKNRFLADQPYGVEMTPEKSLYDLAARVFATEQVMLREHFRSVAPIIAYSNRHFYSQAIAPLRIAKVSERIDPPLVDIRVRGGLRDARGLNTLEAQAIAAEIEALLAQPRFAERTLGVVSLLGMPQAQHIDQVVRARCDAAELRLRRFECGDARTFQGSERDIMFLSLVASPDACRAVSGNMFEQRFNVAASRARDRMYLVRSVELSDLSERDLRVTLLSHFRQPLVADEAEPAALVDRCETGFERAVFAELSARGYRVIPQVRTGAHRIDLVVEGARDARLAIECDGDEYHGPERWPQDMHRQRALERAGWVFWRCFASTWALHRDAVLKELLQRLDAMGIEPLGALERAPVLVELREWPPQAPTTTEHASH